MGIGIEAVQTNLRLIKLMKKYSLYGSLNEGYHKN